jgi:hypothetical protein
MYTFGLIGLPRRMIQFVDIAPVSRESPCQPRLRVEFPAPKMPVPEGHGTG